jgi:hybrid cluster-associated redox disulfide protein
MLGEKIVLRENTTIAQVLNAWPQTVPFFIQHRMDCIGCPVASFCTVQEASQHYDLDLQGDLQRLVVGRNVKKVFFLDIGRNTG